MTYLHAYSSAASGRPGDSDPIRSADSDAVRGGMTSGSCRCSVLTFFWYL